MEKRTRGTNFSFEEKASLLYLVGKYFSIIENKRTDSTTSRIKDQAWLKVASEFNKDSDTENQRSMKQLRICYENIKRKMKRENISPFEYYSRKPPNHLSKKIVPILPKPQDQEGDEPENMLVMVNPDMVTPDLFDSNDATNISCEDDYGRDQNPLEYCSTPIISIQRTGSVSQSSLHNQLANDSGIRIVSVDSCAPSSNLITESLRMGLPESTSVNRLGGQPCSLSPSTETNEVVESSESSKRQRLISMERPESVCDEDECVRLRRKLLRRQLKKCRRDAEMEMERHVLQLELMQAESKRKEELCELEREALLAKKAYYQHLLQQHKGEGNDEGRVEENMETMCNGAEEESM